MCTAVEVSRSLFLSDIMRRVSPRTGYARSPATVRRRLFGASEPADREALSQNYDDQMKEMSTEARHRWNFDFSSETPLQGRFEWSPVRTRSSSRPSTSAATASDSAVKVTAPKLVESARQPEDVQGTKKQSCPELAQASRKVKNPVQTKVTDFMSQRKRKSATSKQKIPCKAKVKRESSTESSSATTT